MLSFVVITDKSLPSSKNLKRVFRVHYRGHSWLRSPYIWGTIYVFIPFKWLQMKQEGWKIVFSCKWSKRDDKLYFHWGKGLLTMKKNHKYFIFKAFQTVPRPKSSKVVGRPRTTSDDLGRLWTTSDDFGRLFFFSKILFLFCLKMSFKGFLGVIYFFGWTLVISMTLLMF